MTTLVDVHYITLPNSVKTIDFSRQAGIVVHEVIGNPPPVGTTNLMANRLIGFAQGTAPYVSWADPDDTLVDNIYTDLAAVLDTNPNVAGVYSTWGLVQDGKQYPVPYMQWSKQQMKQVRSPLYCGIHQVCVIRRSVLNAALTDVQSLMTEYPLIAEAILFAKIANLGGFLAVNEIGYWWLNHGTNKCSVLQTQQWQKLTKQQQQTLHDVYLSVLGA